MSWTEERIATLTKMWEGGATASQIADELGGVSRNAVIGNLARGGAAFPHLGERRDTFFGPAHRVRITFILAGRARAGVASGRTGR